MDCRVVFLFCLVALLLAIAECRTKKVVIHVPYKVKKIKHTHTVYKTIHHHHTHHDPHLDHALSPSEEHEHFHHMHIHEEPPVGQHSQPVPGISIPEFLPDVPLDVPLDLPDIPRELPVLPNRHVIPLYRRT
ncbi:histone-lysine N-methyltransferase, H3 lysine-79 specific-like [Ostrinia nubilalis]|uniref:histone-lysine N-methyltransferase, H3 lysine-79 specific-like n=1 Tax=Ostrinia furnacalis TaxID=93504 RepID=UPI001039DE33|nr:histone-lysine N-methyltransferase, H3 lysine-79 specific-like [Ostrinia furnacalis]